MPTTPTSTEAGTLAGELYTLLTADQDLTLPAVDFTDPEFQIPDSSIVDVPSLTEADLTTRAVGGTGMFDALMEAFSAHIQREFDKGRLTGAQYAEAYIQGTTSALGSAVQYLLSRDTARWQAVAAQRQADAAAVALVQARIQAEESKARLAIAQFQAKTAGAEYSLTKLRLATEDANWNLAKRQVEKAAYEVTYLLPAQLIDLQRGTDVKTAQRDQILYQLANIDPAQKQKLDGEVAILGYQLSDFYPAQVAGFTADTAGKEYNNQFLLPEQLENLKEQTEGHRSKTMNTRRGGGNVLGSVGKQMDLYDEQIASYKRDAETKVLQVMMNAWTTSKTMNEGVATPGGMQNDEITTVVNRIRTRLQLN